MCRESTRVGGVEECVVVVMGEGERALACTHSVLSAATGGGGGGGGVVMVMVEEERALAYTPSVSPVVAGGGVGGVVMMMGEEERELVCIRCVEVFGGV